MVAVPLHAEGRVAAVLCLASSQPRAFEGCAPVFISYQPHSTPEALPQRPSTSKTHPWAQREVWALAWGEMPLLDAAGLGHVKWGMMSIASSAGRSGRCGR